jgi:hypothetical protein
MIGIAQIIRTNILTNIWPESFLPNLQEDQYFDAIKFLSVRLNNRLRRRFTAFLFKI